MIATETETKSLTKADGQSLQETAAALLFWFAIFNEESRVKAILRLANSYKDSNVAAQNVTFGEYCENILTQYNETLSTLLNVDRSVTINRTTMEAITGSSLTGCVADITRDCITGRHSITKSASKFFATRKIKSLDAVSEYLRCMA